MSTERDAVAPTTYSTKQLAEATGLTFRQLDYWQRTGRITASVADAEGSGSRRRWSEHDLALVTAVKARLDMGLSLDAAFDPNLAERIPALPAEVAA